MPVALVLGGAAGVWDDARTALALCEPDAVFAVNDMIALWPGRIDYAATLHNEKAAAWIADRKARGHPLGFEVWSQRLRLTNTQRRAMAVDREHPDRGGSSGLFATDIAIAEGFRVVLCGVPMDKPSGHVVRGKPWNDASFFRNAWIRHCKQLQPFVRSMSGWTREQFGPPTPEWLSVPVR